MGATTEVITVILITAATGGLFLTTTITRDMVITDILTTAIIRFIQQTLITEAVPAGKLLSDAETRFPVREA